MKLRDIALAAMLSLYSASTTAENNPEKAVIHYFFQPSETGELYKDVVKTWRAKLGRVADVKLYCTSGDDNRVYDRWYCGFKLGKSADSASSLLKIIYHTEELPAVFVEKDGKTVRVKSDEMLCGALGLEAECLK